jgi:MFS family permease
VARATSLMALAPLLGPIAGGYLQVAFGWRAAFILLTIFSVSKVIPIGQGMLRRVLREYSAHFHHERNHQGVGKVLIMPRASCEHREGPVIRRPRLGGLLNYYERVAA